MRAVQPGKPQAKLQAISSAKWEHKRLVIYLSGNAVVILGGPQEILQTIYLDHCDELQAVTLDDTSGKIAVASGGDVFIYKPYGKDEGILKWILDTTLRLSDDHKGDVWLSWGSEEELLTGRSDLDLFQTRREGRRIWHQALPKPAKYAVFSPDASMIASTGIHDCLIKLWRRQSFEEDDTRFDFSYLPHPASVTSLRWREPPVHDKRIHERAVDYVVYSVCVDGKIRVWAMTNPHDVSPMHLWAQIDMLDCLQPRGIDKSVGNVGRVVAFLDRAEIANAASAFAESRLPLIGSEDRQRGHLSEILESKSDICIVFDRHGNMSTWGLVDVGCLDGQKANIINISHVQDAYIASEQKSGKPISDNLVVQCFLHDQGILVFLIHHLDGQVIWQTGEIEKFFDPLPCQERLLLKATWTGHQAPITKFSSEAKGLALLSWTDGGEALLWRRGDDFRQHLLSLESSFESKTPVCCCCILPGGHFVVTSNLDEICLWDARSPVVQLAASCPNEVDGETLCLALQVDADDSFGVFYILATSAVMEGLIYKVTVPAAEESAGPVSQNPPITVTKYCNFGASISESLDSIVYTNTSGSANLPAKSQDLCTQACLIGCTKSGTVYCFSVRVEPVLSRARTIQTSKFHTVFSKPSLCVGSCTEKIAIVGSTSLRMQIWDARACHLEYDEEFGPSNAISALKWSYTTDAKSVLAIGFPHHVMILAQTRMDFDAKSLIWAPIREIPTKSLTSHPIGDVAWLGHDSLVIGAGNQLYVCSEDVAGVDLLVQSLPTSIKSRDLINTFDLVSFLNQSLPVFHPEFLSQYVLAGKIELCSRIAITLHHVLKYFAPGDDLDSSLSLSPKQFYVSNGADSANDDEIDELDAEAVVTLSETLAKIELPLLTGDEQSQLAQVIECLSLTHNQRQAMDLHGLRFHFMLNDCMLSARHTNQPNKLSWREIVWAQYSTSQDILIDCVTKQHRGKVCWEQARDSGMFMWLVDRSALERQFETIARNEYSSTEERNPIDCSLYYLALRKKNVLIGLWRMATWNREQVGTQKLLKNDFSQARWRTAASKNAYALMGKRRFEYAAAWFILADKPQDAVNICANQMDDIQLAIAVARVYAGDDSSVLHSLLEEKILPRAARTGDRWQATWAFTMLRRNDMAVRALVEPLHDLIKISGTPQAQAFSYLAHDPLLIAHYRTLRDQARRRSSFSWPISPRVEWDFVINTARTYDRMGCGLLSIDLLRNWEFTPPSAEPMSPSPEAKKQRRKSARRRSSAAVSPTAKTPTKEKPKPTMFEEPSSNSLLDSFGF